MDREWKGIVWHHSASPDKQTRDWDGIVKYHTSYRIDYNIVTKEVFEERLKNNQGKKFEYPWKAVGYHGGIDTINGTVKFIPGRTLDMIGSHAGIKGTDNGFNKEYLGFCAIGNYDLAAPPPIVWKKAIEVTKEFMNKFSISKSRIIGHREVYDKLGIPRQKMCPGKCWDMDLFRNDL